MNQLNQTILITGGTGFAGSHLVEALLVKGYSRIHVTSYGSDPGFISKLLPADNIHALNLTDFEETKAMLATIQPHQIYHLASLAGVESSFNKLKTVLEINTNLQLSLLLAVKEVCPTARVITIGSALEYLPQTRPLKETDELGPVSPYGVSKVTQDMLAFAFFKQDKLQIIRTRSFNHIGERQAPGFVVSDFIQAIIEIENKQESILKVGNLSAVRDFTDVKDTVQAYILLMNNGIPGEVYNVGSGTGYEIQKILDILVGQAQTTINIQPDTSKMRPIDVPQVIANIDKIKLLGWKPTISINETLKRTLEYYRNHI